MKKAFILFAILLATQVFLVGHVFCEDKQSQWIFDISQAQRSSPPVYDPSGKPDPFQPIFSENLSKAVPTVHQTDCVSNPVLENIDLSQLKLTGIVMTERQPIALVQEANGKGHVISNNMCIGIHGGKVAEILIDRVIIQEEMQDLSGKVKVKKTEKKLRRDIN
jgi:Tfp pilus assembly protein PilP